MVFIRTFLFSVFFISYHHVENYQELTFFVYELDLNGIQFSLSVLHAYTKITNNNLVINSLYHVVSKNNMNKK